MPTYTMTLKEQYRSDLLEPYKMSLETALNNLGIPGTVSESTNWSYIVKTDKPIDRLVLLGFEERFKDIMCANNITEVLRFGL